MKIKVLLFLLIFCGAAQAQIQLDTYGEFYHGSSMVLKVHSINEADRFMIVWQGKAINIVPECSDGGCEAFVLLPFEYDLPGRHTLGVAAFNAGCFVGDEEMIVSVDERQYSEQKLTVDPKYVTLSEENINRAARERVLTAAALKHFSDERQWGLPFIKPAGNGITSFYGQRRTFNGEPRSKHSGVDFKASSGTEIVAVGDGTVILTGDFYFAGNSVYVDHGQGVVSMYFHLSGIDVKMGQVVRAGDIVGKSGATGRVTGSHLHFGLAVQGVLIDPLPLFDITSVN